MTLLSLLEIALLAYVPGALLFRAPVLDPERRASLPAEERVFWAVILSVSVSCMVTLALASIGSYRFGRLLAINAGVSAAALLVWRGGLRYQGAAPRPNAATLVPIGLVALCLWLHGPPAEYVMGGKDPGSYVNAGIQVAQRGALEPVDPLVASIPPALRDLFYPSHRQATYYGVRFMGFFIIDPDRGYVLSQFPHLFPSSIAIAYGVDGLTGARYATFLWSLLGLVAVYLTGARLFGRLPAACGAGLLALNLIEVWWARYPNAEVVAQALLFAALLAWSRAQVDDQPFFGPVAASLIGMLLFLRVDMILALGGFVGAAIIGHIAGRRAVVAFFATLTLWLALGALYLFGLMQPYMALPIGFVSNLPLWQMTLLGLTAIAALVLLAGAARLQGMRRLLPLMPWALIVAALAATSYAYFFRRAGGRIADFDAMAFRSFGWYVTPLGLGVAMLGYVAAVRRWLTRDSVFLLTLTIYSAFFFYKLRIVPEHYWMSRRFLPMILPGALLLAGYAAVGRWRATDDERGGGRRWTYVVQVVAGSLVVGGLAWAFWQQSRVLFHHVEYAGLIPRLERIASTFGDSDLVIVESRDASDVHVLALPLAYIYARNVLLLANRTPDPLQFKAFLEWARTRYSNVYFVGGGGTELLSRDVGVEPVDTQVFQVPEWESTRNELPKRVRRKEFDFSVYRFVPQATGPQTTSTNGPQIARTTQTATSMTAAPPTTTSRAIALDLGVNDDLNVLRFHAKERHANGTTFRWSRDFSYVSLVGIPATARTVTFVMSDGHRPPGVPAAKVEVTLNDHSLGAQVVGRDLAPYSFAIPVDVAAEAAARTGPSRLRLTTNIWRPRDIIGGPDDRELGVMIDRVEVR